MGGALGVRSKGRGLRFAEERGFRGVFQLPHRGFALWPLSEHDQRHQGTAKLDEYDHSYSYLVQVCSSYTARNAAVWNQWNGKVEWIDCWDYSATLRLKWWYLEVDHN